MPPLPVIANTYRFTLPWLDSTHVVGVQPVNVLHFRATSGTVSSISGVVETALNAHGSLMFDVIYTGLSLQSMEVLPLDGSSATFVAAVSPSVVGGGSGGVVPNCATVVSLHTGQRGSRGRGRVYVGPMGETQIDNGTVVATSQANMLSAWGSFVNDINVASPSVQLVVASYKYADAHDVTNIRIDKVLGTQRRRQNQLR
jgi:hypothetical protein